MLFYSIARKYIVRLAGSLLYYLLPLALMLRFLNSTVVGVAFFSVVLYLYRSAFSESPPWSGEQLALWIDGLDPEIQATIATSVLTILGFLIAFNSASSNWKEQAFDTIKLNAANELQTFLDELNRQVSTAQIGAEYMLEAVNAFHASGPTYATQAKVRFAIEQAVKFKAAKLQIDAMASEVHRLLGAHGMSLATMPNAYNWLQVAADSIAKIASKSSFWLPEVSPSDNNLCAAFAYRFEEKKCAEFIRCCEENANAISRLFGGAIARLRESIVPLKLTTMFSVKLSRKDFADSLEELLRKGTPGD